MRGVSPLFHIYYLRRGLRLSPFLCVGYFLIEILLLTIKEQKYLKIFRKSVVSLLFFIQQHLKVLEIKNDDFLIISYDL